MKHTLIFLAVALPILLLPACAQGDPNAQGFNNVRHTAQGCYVQAPDDTPDEHGFGKKCPT